MILCTFEIQDNISNPSKWEERLKLIGFCYLIKASVVREIGYLDERFTPGNFEDDDYSIRIRKAGYKLLLCKDTFIHHFGSVSFKASENKYSDLMKQNAVKFEEKWGFDPNYSQHIRFEIVELITEPRDAELNVLEVGCACGGTLLEIKNRFKNSQLYGIELNQSAAEVGSLIADVRPENVERETMDYPESFFDYIIFADVLEHLYDPWSVLTNIRKYLKPSGKLLVSLPNIMHYSVMRQLLNGFWSYAEAGILDRTHIRFFTLNEINKMLETTGYKLIQVGGTQVPMDDIDNEFIEKLAAMGQAELKPQFQIYQYILSTSKNELFDVIPALLESKEESSEVVFDKLQAFTTQEILNAVESLVKDNHSKIELLNLLGVKHFEKSLYQNVIPYFERVLVYDRNNKDTLYNLSYFLKFIGEDKEAEYYMEQLKRNDKDAFNELLSITAEFTNPV